MCELAGFTGYDPYVDFLNTARQTLPVLCPKDDVFMLEDGTLASDISGEQSDILRKIDWWQYYRLKY